MIKGFLSYAAVCIAGCLGAHFLVQPAVADVLIHSYDGNVLPYATDVDNPPGWLIADACETVCTESLVDGKFQLTFDWPGGDLANYHKWVALPPEKPPATFWVEWQFRSNYPFQGTFDTCDGAVAIRYEYILIQVFMYGNAVIGGSGDHGMSGLELNEFRTLRFESLDGTNYTVSVDGVVFIESASTNTPPNYYLQFRSEYSCGQWIPLKVHQWDFVRYGEISYGEKVLAADPPAGFVPPDKALEMDAFTVTYDSPNYVYVDEVTVDTTAPGTPPKVTKTRRLDNGPPDAVEIALDKPVTPGYPVTFTFDDGVVQNAVTYVPLAGDDADIDADGDTDLADAAFFLSCLGSPSAACRPMDLDHDDAVTPADWPAVPMLLTGPAE